MSISDLVLPSAPPCSAELALVYFYFVVRGEMGDDEIALEDVFHN